MKNCFVIYALFLLLSVHRLYGQDTARSIHQLPVFTIKENRINRYSCGLLLQKIDSLGLQSGTSSTMGDILSQSTTGFVKTMGPGSLSSFSLRGSSVYQTAVLWNGVDIRAPGAGMIDLTLIPGGFFESVELLHGGAGALCGNGVIGGSLVLTNEPDFKPAAELAAGAGWSSFHGNDQHFRVKWSSSGTYFSTAVYKRYSLNNFKYRLGSSKAINEHARTEQQGLMQTLQRKFSESCQGGYSLWLEQADRQIAPSMTSADHGASRDDFALRFLPSFRFTRAKGMFSVKAGLLRDYLRYIEKPGDSILLLDSKIMNTVLTAESEYSARLGRGCSLGTGVNLQSLSADIGSNGGKNRQVQSAILIDFRKEWKSRWVISLNLRQQFTEGYSPVPAPSAGVEGYLGNVHLRSNVSQNYRLPSLNDRFWQPGSNQDLRPEISRNAEAGFDYSTDFGPVYTASLHATAFLSEVTDWIAWVPGSSYWTVQNIQKVVNRGTECSFGFSAHYSHARVMMSGSYTFVRSTYEKELYPGDLSYGKQLMYNPKHRFTGNVGLQYKALNVNYQHGYTGRTYTRSDNSDFLPVYDIANVSATFVLPAWKGISARLQAEILNLWDKNYQVVAYYPMPGRWFKGGIVLKSQKRGPLPRT